MRFFEPSSKFLDWLAKRAAGRIVFDVGCGEGHILKELHKRKVKAIGIDPLWETQDLSLISAVILQFAEDCPLLRRSKNSLVLFCRPCHSLFVERVLEFLDPSNEVLYISKPDNLGVDFSLEQYWAKPLKTPKCPEEKVWLVSSWGPGKL